MIENDPEEEIYLIYIQEAERNAQKALDHLYDKDGPKRSLWHRLALGRAQSILMSLLQQELRWRKKQK